MDDAAERTAELMDQWLDAIVVWWDGHGRAHVLAGPDAGGLPGAGPIHVLTAQDPGGERQPPARNRELLAELLGWAADELGPVGERWWPATGTSAALDYHEQGVAIAGLERTEAAEIGARYRQLAVYEMTDRDLRVVTCASGDVEAEVPRSWPGDRPGATIPEPVLATWWSAYLDAGLPLGDPG